MHSHLANALTSSKCTHIYHPTARPISQAVNANRIVSIRPCRLAGPGLKASSSRSLSSRSGTKEERKIINVRLPIHAGRGAAPVQALYEGGFNSGPYIIAISWTRTGTGSLKRTSFSQSRRSPATHWPSA